MKIKINKVENTKWFEFNFFFLFFTLYFQLRTYYPTKDKARKLFYIFLFIFKKI